MVLALGDIPENIRRLERDRRGYPIPWFVFRPEDGSIDFRVMHPDRFILAVRARLCWVCGQPHGAKAAFIGGPLSTAQGLYADPPAHIECAEFSVRVCPYLAIPSAQRREANIPGHTTTFGGDAVLANPGVFGIAVSDGFTMAGRNIQAMPASEIRWYCQGKPARRIQIKEAMSRSLQDEKVRRHPHFIQIRKLMRALPLPMS